MVGKVALERSAVVFDQRDANVGLRDAETSGDVGEEKDARLAGGGACGSAG
jgi:hypothetical protein